MKGVVVESVESWCFFTAECKPTTNGPKQTHTQNAHYRCPFSLHIRCPSIYRCQALTVHFIVSIQEVGISTLSTYYTYIYVCIYINELNHNSVVMTVLRRGMRDLSVLLLGRTLSFTSQGEMSSSRLVSPEDLLLFMMLLVKWLLVSGWLLMVLFLLTELDLARLEAAKGNLK